MNFQIAMNISMRIQTLVHRHATAPERPEFDAISADAVLLQKAFHDIPQLSRDGVAEVESCTELPPDTRVVVNVGMDCVETCVVERGGEAIGTGGVSTCIVLTAEGIAAPNTEHAGKTVLGLLHRCSDALKTEDDAKFTLQAMRNAMGEKGVHAYETCVIGGSLYGDLKRADSVAAAIALAQAAQAEGALKCARIGVTQTQADDVRPKEERTTAIPLSTSLPESVCVVATAAGVFYAGEPDDEASLFIESEVSIGETPIDPVVE